MGHLAAYYFDLVLRRPALTLLLVAVAVVAFGYQAQHFRLDASADSLVLENDAALETYRAVRSRYGSDDFLIITYTPNGDLFGEESLANLRALRDELKALPRVQSITSLLDVPLIQSPPVSISSLRDGIPSWDNPRTDKSLARDELVSSPLYRNLITSPDGTTTAIQLFFKRDDNWHSLLKQRNSLREQELRSDLSKQEAQQLALFSRHFDEYSAKMQDRQDRDIAAVRSIMTRYQHNAQLHVGGVPMIASDSIAYIRHDLSTFGIGVAVFLVLILAIAFRRMRWVLLPMLTCVAAGLVTVGVLGLVDWPVTVVSSNFVSLLLIITLSLTVHLIVRHRELHALTPKAEQYELLQETLRSKAGPCFYTAITTIVAFGSLLFSGIRPVIDFGWMMCIGVAVAFVLVFTLFPAALMLLRPGDAPEQTDWTTKITGVFARLIKSFQISTLVGFTVLIVISAIGVAYLTVENRFIDYFKDSTEIYQGMELIDTKLGGTTPLDVLIDAPSDFEPMTAEEAEEVGITGSSYWFNTFQLEEVGRIHRYLDSLPETGKVLSLDTAIQTMSQIDSQIVANDFFLSLFYKKLPQEIKTALVKPYLSADGNQLRFSIRVFESDPSLQRQELLEQIRTDLSSELGLEPEQVQLSGMLVLYNNMLQSLFKSQILTIGVVFLAILIMFAVSFRNLKMALIAIVPNVFAAALVLGLMGWLGIPLDIMTITIAAISIGIAVDDTIHYVHRITEEFAIDHDYWAAVKRSHASIGRAMYYTTITITLGFSILALSNFVPTIYFGLLTGFAMLVALLADLMLLPLLIVRFKPLGRGI